MSATLSGEAVAILPKVVAPVPPKRGHDPRLIGAVPQLCSEDGPPLWQSWAGLARPRARQHFAGASKSDRHDHLFVCLLSRRELLAVSCLIEPTLYGSTLWTQWSIRGFAGQLMMINAFAQCASRAARQRGQQGVELLRSLHEYLGGRR